MGAHRARLQIHLLKRALDGTLCKKGTRFGTDHFELGFAMSGYLRPLVLLSYLWALAACDTALGTNTTQSLAKSVVNNAIESRVPGVPVAPVTDCVIESASGSEIVDIANDGADGKVSEETVLLIAQISLRPQTVECFVNDAGPTVATQIALAL